VVIPNAVDPEQCRGLGSRSRGRERLASLGLVDAAPVFVSVGRLEANKGFDVLVAALARAAPALPDSWAWVLAGDGPVRGSLVRALAEAGLGRHAVLAGRLDDADLHSLYAAADWFVHPTRYEGSSIVTLEAMAHGLPVLASRTGGLPDKVDDGVTGFLVPPGDAAALGDRLQATVAVDGRAFGEAGRRLCESRFSWDVVAPRYVALYERLSRGPS
jgi:glycosyltransferase involved in cell wall biosynthesis